MSVAANKPLNNRFSEAELKLTNEYYYELITKEFGVFLLSEAMFRVRLCGVLEDFTERIGHLIIPLILHSSLDRSRVKTAKPFTGVLQRTF